MAFLLAVLLLLIDFLWWKRQWLFDHRITVTALAFCIFLASLPLLSSGLNAGHDLQFHLKRIEGIAVELRNGVFPVRLSSMWMGGYGYPTSVYYGDILLYLPAILRLIGVPILTVYKIYVFCINILTAGIAFLCFRGIFRRESTAAVVTMAYCLSCYRLVNIYIRAACGEYSAIAFLPLIALALHRIYVENSAAADLLNAKKQKGASADSYGNKELGDISAELQEGRDTYMENAAFLAFGMTGILQTHILSADDSSGFDGFLHYLLENDVEETGAPYMDTGGCLGSASEPLVSGAISGLYEARACAH